MSAIARATTIVLLAGAMALAGGCAFLRGSATGTAFVDADKRHLQLPGAHQPSPRAVAYRSPYGYEEYERSQVDGRAEAVLLLAGGSGIALDVSAGRLEPLAASWAYNSPSRALEWTSSAQRTMGDAATTYRLYRLRTADDAAARDCVAFVRTWAFSALDPLMRPSKAYFGYWCRPMGRTLSAVAARNYLRRIEVASPPLPGFHLGKAVPHDPRASAQANGAADAVWGLRAFPLNRIRHYPLGGTQLGGY